MMSNGVSNLVSASGLSGFKACQISVPWQCSNTLDFLLPTDFCQKAARNPNAWPPGRRTRDLDANRGYRRTAGSPDAAAASVSQHHSGAREGGRGRGTLPGIDW